MSLHNEIVIKSFSRQLRPKGNKGTGNIKSGKVRVSYYSSCSFVSIVKEVREALNSVSLVALMTLLRVLIG